MSLSPPTLRGNLSVFLFFFFPLLIIPFSSTNYRPSRHSITLHPYTLLWAADTLPHFTDGKLRPREANPFCRWESWGRAPHGKLVFELGFLLWFVLPQGQQLMVIRRDVCKVVNLQEMFPHSFPYSCSQDTGIDPWWDILVTGSITERANSYLGLWRVWDFTCKLTI